MVDSTLQHLIFGMPNIADKASDTPDVLAVSDGLTPEDARKLTQNVPLAPLPLNQRGESQAVAYVSLNSTYPDHHILARAHFQNESQGLPVHQYIIVPDATMKGLGDIDPLLKLINTPIENYNVTNAPLEPLVIPPPPTWSLDKDVTFVKQIINDLVDGEMRLLLGILGAALQRKIVIRNFPLENQPRLNLIRGITLFLPKPLRSELTFTTFADEVKSELPHITLSNTQFETETYQLDWESKTLDESAYEHPYVAHLLSLWDNNITGLFETLRTLDIITISSLSTDASLNDMLTAIVERHQLDLQILKGETAQIDVMVDAVDSDVPMSLELRTAYFINLLETNFTSRDTQNAQYIAAQLEAQPRLKESLKPFFNSALAEQPDAVYAFVRTWLNTQPEDNMDEDLLKRLHDAAQASVDVAIESADPATIRNWLTLIAREPLRYGMGDILQQGIRSAQPFVAESEGLAQELLILAVKRQPDMLEGLLEDEALVSALPKSVQRAIIDLDYEAIDKLAASSRELFLLAVKRVLDSRQRRIAPSTVRAVWAVHTQQQTNILPPQYRPLTLIQEMVANPDVFINGALNVLLSLVAANSEYDELFFTLVQMLSDNQSLSELMTAAFQQSGRSIEGVMRLQSNLLADEIVNAQSVVDTYAQLLNNRNWDESMLPLIEQLARVMTQHPDTHAPTGTLWKLTELSAVHKSEQMLKVSLRRLLDDISEMVGEQQVVDSIQRLRKDTLWSTTSRPVLLRWWRAYVRELGTAKLQKLDKALDGKRVLEEFRAVVQTNIAMRRIIGNRSLEEFSAAVATTYNLLQALSEGFDANDKLVDSATIRHEMESRASELPSELRPVLSTNLKELAQIVTTLSENRSKPSLIRSDDAVERQLVTGEQQPQSAIDVMRWLSGYLDGIQKEEDDEQT